MLILQLRGTRTVVSNAYHALREMIARANIQTVLNPAAKASEATNMEGVSNRAQARREGLSSSLTWLNTIQNQLYHARVVGIAWDAFLHKPLKQIGIFALE